MELSDLLADVGSSVTVAVSGPLPGVEIAHVTLDSRTVADGSLFACVRGETADGHRFAEQAVAAGAVAILAEADGDLPETVTGSVPVLRTDGVRRALGPVAAAVAGHPSRQLRLVGVTGTNGKTTVVNLLASIGAHVGVRVDTVGTLTGVRTTPEAPDLQTRLAEIAADGGDVVAVEVSSHALDQHRVDATSFAVGAFTNLSPDHLNYHGSMDVYFDAKARLFTDGFIDQAVIVTDNAYGRAMQRRATAPVTEVDPGAVEALDLGVAHAAFSWRGLDVRLPIGGRFNVANALVAAECALLLDIEAADIAAGLTSAAPIAGRFEPVPLDADFAVIVDYAHTPDGLENLLSSVRETLAEVATAEPGRVIVVFGCGGDRDRDKRPMMGEVAERLADEVVVTSDNPRSEDPDAIIQGVLSGMSSSPRVDADRRSAIDTALTAARAGDVVVIAGKGHETTQTIGDDVIDFDDRLVAREVWEARR